MVGPDFVYTAPILAGTILFTYWMTGIVPDLLVSGLLGLSIVIAAFSRLALVYERKYADNLVKRLAIPYSVVGAPMFLFGLAFSMWSQGWTMQEALVAGCACLIANVVAITALHGRLPGMAVAMAGMTTGGILVPAPVACGVLLGSSAIGVGVLANRYMKRVAVAGAIISMPTTCTQKRTNADSSSKICAMR